MNKIQKSEQHELVVGGNESIASFFLPGHVDRAFKESNWDVTEMVEILTSIIREEETRTTTNRLGESIEESIVTPKERMAAMKMLHDVSKEAMVIGGLIRNNRLHLEKILDDGTKVEYDSETMEILEKGSSRLTDTMSLLERAATTDDIIDVDYKLKEENNEPRAGHNRSPDLTSGPDGSVDGRSSDVRGGSDTGRDGSGGDVKVSEVCPTEERTPTSNTRIEERQCKDNDESPTGGAKNERSTRIPRKFRRSRQSKTTGNQHEQNDGNDGAVSPTRSKYPHVPGSQHLSAPGPFPAGSDPSKPGIPIRSPGDRSDPNVRTAESLTSRLERLERAREAGSNPTRREESGPNEKTQHPDESGNQSVTGTP